MHPAEHALDVVAAWPVTIELEVLRTSIASRSDSSRSIPYSLRLERTVGSPLPSKPEPIAAIATRPSVSGTDERCSPARCSREDGATRAVGEQVPMRAPRDVEQEFSERLYPRASAMRDQLDELRCVVFLATRDERRPFAIEDQAQRADPVVGRGGGVRRNRLASRRSVRGPSRGNGRGWTAWRDRGAR